MMSKDDLFDDV